MENKFIIRCPKCRWARMSTGLTKDLQDLHEYKSCLNCGKIRSFRCIKCGNIAKMTRVKNG